MHVQLTKKNGIYLWFYNFQAWCMNIIIILYFPQSTHNEKRKEIQNKNNNNKPHFIKNHLHVNCLHFFLIMCNNKIIIIKTEFITSITDSMILMDSFENPTLILQLIILHQNLIFQGTKIMLYI